MGNHEDTNESEDSLTDAIYSLSEVFLPTAATSNPSSGGGDGDSSSDDEAFVRAKIGALSKPCLPTSTTNLSSGSGGGGSDVPAQLSSSKTFLGTITSNLSSSTGAAGKHLLEDEDDDDDDNLLDDLELVRSIQARYGVEITDVQPLATLPPPVSDDDDDENDYEFYCSIKKRYAKDDDDDDDDKEDDAAGGNGSASGGIADAAGNTDGTCRDESVPKDFTSTALRSESVDEIPDDFERELIDSAEKEDAFRSASSFPQAAQKFIEAIKKNRYCQKFVRDKLLHMEAKMEELKDIRKRLKTVRDFQVGCKKKIGRVLSQKQDARVQLISTPKQRANAKGTESNVSAMCHGPQENSYVACYKDALEKVPLSFHREKWSEKDKENLEKGIVRQYQEKLLRRSAEDLSSAEEPSLTNGVDARMLLIKNHNITHETIQSFSREVNWQQLASTYLPRRSGEECEARWLNHENRLINKDHWTKQEDIKLLSLIEKNGMNSWQSVAEQLATNRTPYQCLARYQRSLNASILRSEWTEDEDAQLCSAVESFGESNWQAVASVLERRTGTQCSNRWKKTLHPTIERVGKWDDDEDKRLKVAVTLFGKSWHKIAQFVPGRTQSQCRERWVNVLDPSLTRGEWTEEEDMQLRKAIEEHGYSWSRVAACIPPRTDNQCQRRWTRLCPSDVPRLKAARSIQKVALISNFVDREEERPTLGPKDFVSLPCEGSTNGQENSNGTQKRKRKRKYEEIEPTEKLSSSLKRGKHKKTARTPNNNTIDDSVAEESNYEETSCVDKEMASKKSSKLTKRNAVKDKRQPKNKSCENKETDQNGEADSLEIPIKFISRRAGGVKSKTHSTGEGCSNKKKSKRKHKKSKVDTDLSEEREEWEDLPLSALFQKALTRTH